MHDHMAERLRLWRFALHLMKVELRASPNTPVTLAGLDRHYRLSRDPEADVMVDLGAMVSDSLTGGRHDLQWRLHNLFVQVQEARASHCPPARGHTSRRLTTSVGRVRL